jgi:hypothetical protein
VRNDDVALSARFFFTDKSKRSRADLIGLGKLVIQPRSLAARRARKHRVQEKAAAPVAMTAREKQISCFARVTLFTFWLADAAWGG